MFEYKLYYFKNTEQFYCPFPFFSSFRKTFKGEKMPWLWFADCMAISMVDGSPCSGQSRQIDTNSFLSTCVNCISWWLCKIAIMQIIIFRLL